MDLFSQIPIPIETDQAPSEMKDLLTRRKRNEISHEEYILGNAHGIAVSLQAWKPIQYVNATPEMQHYVDQRLKGLQEHNQTLGFNLGIWLHAVTRDLGENNRNMETLVWADEILRRNKLHTEADRVQFFLPLYHKLEFPEAYYTAGRKVQIRDSHIVQSKLRDR